MVTLGVDRRLPSELIFQLRHGLQLLKHLLVQRCCCSSWLEAGYICLQLICQASSALDLVLQFSHPFQPANPRAAIKTINRDNFSQGKPAFDFLAEVFAAGFFSAVGFLLSGISDFALV